MNPNQIAFEAWYKQQYWDFPDDVRKPGGGYRHLDVQLAWRAFMSGYNVCLNVAQEEINRISGQRNDSNRMIEGLQDELRAAECLIESLSNI